MFCMFTKNVLLYAKYTTNLSHREVNGPGPQLGYTNPIKGDEVHTENGTCGRGAFSSMYRTAIADVVAGEVVGFRVNTAGEIYGAPPDMEFPNSEYGTFFHPGPGQIYLSKAPNDDLKAYRGAVSIHI